MLFKFKFLYSVIFGVFILSSHAHMDAGDDYKLVLKGYQLPMTTEELKKSTGRAGTFHTSGRFDFKPKGNEMRFPSHMHVVGNEYHLTIPKAWVKQYAEKVEGGRGYLLLARLNRPLA